MFRVTVKPRPAGAEVHYHLQLMAFRAGGWRVCGVIVLYPPEWSEFLQIAERERIEVVADEASV